MVQSKAFSLIAFLTTMAACGASGGTTDAEGPAAAGSSGEYDSHGSSASPDQEGTTATDPNDESAAPSTSSNTTSVDPSLPTTGADDGVDPSATGNAETGDPPTLDPFVNADAEIAPGSNPFGIQGDWSIVSDGVTSSENGHPFRDGAYCFTGEAAAEGDASARWGVGLRLHLHVVDGEPLPYEYAGKLNGFRMKVVGTSPLPPRLHFVTDREDAVAPFREVLFEDSTNYWIAEATVPLTFDVPEAGERVDGRPLEALDIIVPGTGAAGPIDVCVTEFEPLDEPAYPGPQGDIRTFINVDGFIRAEDNAFGIQGPVYVFGDGNSTSQTGNPWRDGRYCISGQFTGATSSWGVGIAFDVNNPTGDGRQPFSHRGIVDGFRIGLSGHTPAGARIQFLTNDPEQGEQPFLVAALNTTTNYFIDRAQVPASWSSGSAGRTVGDSFYAVRLYLDGTAGSGPFEVCIDEFLPGTAAELSPPAQPAADGFFGARTIDPRILPQEYQHWKSRHFRDCNDGTACIPRDEGDCISEGVAYGMLLAVGYDDRDAFDKLWAYFRRHTNANGVMNWRTNACGSTISSGSASDGELDAAMALIQASCQWGDESYETDARALIDAIRTSEVTTCGDRTVLKPGDNFGGCNQANPSYFAPAYYKIFLEMTGDATWGDLIDDDYAWMTTLQSRLGGLVPDWADASGTPEAGSRGQYGPDASRTPWRIATDFVWNDEPRATTFLDGVSAYVDESGGVGRVFTPNSNFRGGAAMSAFHRDPIKAQTYTNDWLTTSADDTSYFPGTLRPIYLLLAAHRFQPSCK